MPHRVKGLPERRAFTLIELLIVIAIISILAAALVVGAMHLIDGARLKRSEALLNNLAHALNDYYSEFGAFPPTTVAANANTDEWWRYLTCTDSATATGFQRPQRSDGTVRETPFIVEKDLNLPPTGTTRLPRDGWKNNILYAYPVDNEIAKLTSTDPGDPVSVRTMLAADAYYHCVVIAQGKPPAVMPSVTAGRTTNTSSGPQTYMMKAVSGK